MEHEKLIQDLYYNPNTQLTSIRNLYNAVKQNGVKYDEVKQFIQSQESNQLFKKQKRIKNYFPIAAKHKFDILQTDLVSMSDIAAANENYKYLLVCIDVFSRLAFVVPLKNNLLQLLIMHWRKYLILLNRTQLIVMLVVNLLVVNLKLW